MNHLESRSIQPWLAIWDTLLRWPQEVSLGHFPLHESDQGRKLHIPPPFAFTEGAQMGHIWRWTHQLLLPKRRCRKLSPDGAAYISHTAVPGMCISGLGGLSDLWLKLPNIPQEEEEKELQWDSWALNRSFSHPYLWEPCIKQILPWEPIMRCGKPRRGGLRLTESKCLLWQHPQLTSVYFSLHC